MPARQAEDDSGKYGFRAILSTEIASPGRLKYLRAGACEAYVDSPGRDASAGRNAELAQDVGDMRLDGALADEQFLGNLAVGASGGNVRGDFSLARR